MLDAQTIVVALSEFDPNTAESSLFPSRCFFCSEVMPANDKEHAADCIWVAAKRIAEQEKQSG